MKAISDLSFIIKRRKLLGKIKYLKDIRYNFDSFLELGIDF